jgi:hypothetical protein
MDTDLTHTCTHTLLIESQVLDVRIYGRVATAHMLRLPNETQDVLFLSTERCVCACVYLLCVSLCVCLCVSI